MDLAERQLAQRFRESGFTSYENTTPVRQDQQLVETVLRRELGFGSGAGEGRKGIPGLPSRRM
jgi:hypothetical protein